MPVAAAAVLFQTAVHDLTHLVWDDVPDWLDWSEPAWWYVILVPALAGLLVAAALRLPGHGGHTPLEGLSMEPASARSTSGASCSRLSRRSGSGSCSGPEAPLIAIGLGLPPLLVHLLRLQEAEGRLLVLSGAFAAIAALFGGPIVASLMLFELAAKSGAIPARAIGSALLPGFVAAGTGALIFTGVATGPGCTSRTSRCPTFAAYDSVRIADLGWSIVLAARGRGRGCGRAAPRTRRRRPDVRVVRSPRSSSPACSSAYSRSSSARLRTGRSTSCSSPARARCRSWSRRVLRGVLLAVVLVKGLAYALSLGAGFRGGPVFPAIAIGAALAVAGADLLPGFETTPAIAAGIAAGTAVVLQAPFTGALLASLLMGSSAADVAPIAVIAAAVGALVAVAMPDPQPASG